MKYFTLKELCHSTTADEIGLENKPAEAQERNLRALVDNVLDPLREAWGKPIYVNSGYRCKELNRRVGGVETSHHLSGCAADITTGNSVDNRRLYQLAIDMGLECTELIGGQYDFGWLHVAHVPGRTRRPPR